MFHITILSQLGYHFQMTIATVRNLVNKLAPQARCGNKPEHVNSPRTK